MKQRLQLLLDQMNRIGADTRALIFEPPATLEQVTEAEENLGYSIPEDFRNVLLTTSAHCEFRWFLPDNFPLPPAFRQLFSGELHWGIAFIPEFNQNKDEWIKNVFPNLNDAYDQVWHHKFVFQEVGNGDYLSIDLNPASYGKIIYLSHDDGEGHGYVMANSFPELLTNWIPLGCVGAEDWQWLPFCHDAFSGIDPHHPLALQWKALIQGL